MQDAAMTDDLTAVISEAESGLAEVSMESFVRACEQALRRLNNPAALARCGLIERLPTVMAEARSQNGTPPGTVPTPLEQARAPRESLPS